MHIAPGEEEEEVDAEHGGLGAEAQEEPEGSVVQDAVPESSEPKAQLGA